MYRAVLSYLFLIPHILWADCLIYENGLFRLSLCNDHYELVRLDDPLEAGRFHGSVKRTGDTLILLDFRADSLIRAEFEIQNYLLKPVYLAPNLRVIFRSLKGPFIQSRLINDDQQLLESWEIIDSIGPRVIHYTYDDHLDTRAAYQYLGLKRDGPFWLQDADEAGRFMIIGKFEADLPVGKWIKYRLGDGYRWETESQVKYRGGKVIREKNLRKKKELKNLPF